MPARRARIVLVSSQGRVALIRRRRRGQEYWSFPGGGIKRGESPDRAARREINEELGLDIRPERLLAVASGHALYLATIDGEPPLSMHGPEVARRSRRSQYRPEWVPLHRLTDLDVRPRTARVALVPLAGSTPPAETVPEPQPAPPRPAPVRPAPARPEPEDERAEATDSPVPHRPAAADRQERPRRWARLWRRWARSGGARPWS